MRRGERRFPNRFRARPAAAAAAGPTTAGSLSIAAGATVNWNVRADLGVTIGTGVSAWADQSGNARDFTEVTGLSQPLWSATVATFNDQAAITFDGVDDQLTNTFSRVAPGTTPFWIWIIAQQLTWTADDTLWGDGGASVLQGATLGGVRGYNGAFSAQNNNWTLAKLFRVQFLNTASDYVKIGATSAGTSKGNLASGANTVLGAAPGGVRFANVIIAEAMCCNGTLTSIGTLDADLQAYAIARYGAGVMA